jgi:SAM-dependent methyltransferase
VLFDVWFPDCDRVTLTSLYCKACGFMTYSPRPTDDEIAAKYAYRIKLKRTEEKPAYDSRSKKLDAIRASRIFDQCTEYTGGRVLNVLDYGGGNGKLMGPFVDGGHQCYLIDYNDDPIYGVTRLSDDIRNLDTGYKFDVIICSHVLEHVADVSSLVSSLRERLAPNGILYAEVPQEIWAGIPVEADPVTHINYFTRNSFTNLFLQNGFEVVRSDQQIGSYEKWHLEVTWVLARSSESRRHSMLPADGSVDAVSLPGLQCAKGLPDGNQALTQRVRPDAGVRPGNAQARSKALEPAFGRLPAFGCSGPVPTYGQRYEYCAQTDHPREGQQQRPKGGIAYGECAHGFDRR